MRPSLGGAACLLERLVSGHLLGAFEAHVALGAQFGQLGAIYGDFGYAVGDTDRGLHSQLFSHAAPWEFVVGRVRPGLGARLYLAQIERASDGTHMYGFGGTGVLSLAVDATQGDHENLVLGLEAEAGELGHDSLLYGGMLRLGVRFKVP